MSSLSSVNLSGTPAPETVPVDQPETGSLCCRKVVGGTLLGTGLAVIGAVVACVALGILAVAFLALGALGLGLVIPGVWFLAREESDPSVEQRKKDLPVLIQECKDGVVAIMANYVDGVTESEVSPQHKTEISKINHQRAEYERELETLNQPQKVEEVKATVLPTPVEETDALPEVVAILSKYPKNVAWENIAGADQYAILEINKRAAAAAS